MRVLIALDVDGTIETSAGPVRVDRLRALEAHGAQVVIVSPSPARPDGFPIRASWPTRRECLLAARNDFPADLLLYVSNNGDEAEAEAAGFMFLRETDFR